MKRRLNFIAASCLTALLLCGCGHSGRFLVINYTDQEITVYIDRDEYKNLIPAKGHAYLGVFESTNDYYVSAKSKTKSWAERALSIEEVNRSQVSADVFLLEFR